MDNVDWSKPIPDWYQPDVGEVVPGVVSSPAVVTTKPEVTPPGPKPHKWFEPLFEVLRDTGDRMRWINDEVWILPASEDRRDWYREPIRLGAIELIVATYFDKNDDLRSQIITTYQQRVESICKTRGIDLAHRLARDRFTLRGGDWDGQRDTKELHQSWESWSQTYSQSK